MVGVFLSIHVLVTVTGQTVYLSIVTGPQGLVAISLYFPPLLTCHKHDHSGHSHIGVGVRCGSATVTVRVTVTTAATETNMPPAIDMGAGSVRGVRIGQCHGS